MTPEQRAEADLFHEANQTAKTKPLKPAGPLLPNEFGVGSVPEVAAILARRVTRDMVDAGATKGEIDGALDRMREWWELCRTFTKEIYTTWTDPELPHHERARLAIKMREEWDRLREERFGE